MNSDVLVFSAHNLLIRHHWSPLDFGHDPERHAELEADAWRFCAPTAAVVRLETTSTGVDFDVAEVPYCQMLALKRLPAGEGPAEARPWSVGLNVTVSVDDDRTFVVARRAGKLNGGGAWRVTANEGCQPTDFEGAGLVVPPPVPSQRRSASTSKPQSSNR